jgi:hypothetical protein
MSGLTGVVLGLLGLAPQDAEPARLFKLFDGVYVIEATKPSIAAVPETDGGVAKILAAVPGLVLVQVPLNASLVRLRTAEAVTRDLRLSEAEPPRSAEAIDGLGLEPEGFAMVIDHRGPSWILSMVLDVRGALRSTAFVGSGARIRTELREDEELRVFEPASKAWITRRLPLSVTKRPGAVQEGWGLNTGPLQLRGITPSALILIGRDIRADIGGTDADQVFVTDPGTFEFKDQTFNGFGAGLELDLDLLRISLGFTSGTVDGHGDFRRSSDGLEVSDVNYEGDVRSVTLEAWWPALRTEGEVVGFGVGPALGYALLDEHLKNVGSSFLRFGENVTAQAALLGLRLGFDILPRPVTLRLGGSATRSFGDVETGWLFEGQVGLFIEF